MFLPECKECFFCDSWAWCGHGHDKRCDAECWVYGDQTGPEGGGGRLAAKQQKEAEETNDELKKQNRILKVKLCRIGLHFNTFCWRPAACTGVKIHLKLIITSFRFKRLTSLVITNLPIFKHFAQTQYCLKHSSAHQPFQSTWILSVDVERIKYRQRSE